MRGKHGLAEIGLVRYRITPADAGKTACSRWYSARTWDHPRGCGENYEQLVGGVETLGSPPRMRGKRIGALAGMEQNRITPADAGKTLLIPP